MGCPTEVEIGDNLVFSITTHDPDTGVLTDADAVPPYRVYEDETGTAILTGNMAKLDDANTTGFYTESIACTSGNGFENGKTYTVYIEATVDSDKGGICYGFKAYDNRKANTTQIEGSGATDQINAACDTAFTDYDPPTKAELDSGLAGLNDPTAAAIADAVWDEATAGHVTGGTFGEQLKTDVDAILVDTNALNDTKVPDTISLANINAQCDTALTDYDPPTKAELDSGLAGLNDPTAAAIADAVWDEATTGHVTGGTFGEQVKTDIDAILADTNELQSDDVPGLIAALNDPTAAAIADAVWDEATVGHTTGGTFGEQVKTDVDAILADTNELQTDDVPGLIATAQADLDTLTGTDGVTLATAQANYAPAKAADVNTEVSDVLKTDTISEQAQGKPPAAPTFEEAISYLYMALRNKLDVTATLKEFHNDSGVVVWKKTLSDDGTTYSEAEGATGP